VRDDWVGYSVEGGRGTSHDPKSLPVVGLISREAQRIRRIYTL
jgi:hypothetical protein